MKGSFLAVVPATAVPATSASAVTMAAGAAIVIRNFFTVAPFEVCTRILRRGGAGRIGYFPHVRYGELRLVPRLIRSSC